MRTWGGVERVEEGGWGGRGDGGRARLLDARLDASSRLERVANACGCSTACRRAKAAFEAYLAEQLEVMKSEKPGLRLMQYKSMIFERWQKDPRNPRNAPKPA